MTISPVARPGDVGRRRRRVPEEIAALAARAQLAVAVDDVGLGQRPLHLQLAAGQEVAQLRRRQAAGCAPSASSRKSASVRASVCSVTAVLLLVGLRRGHRVGHHVVHPVGEPALEPEVQRDRGEDRDQDRRDQRDRGEEAHQPHVQLRAGRLAPPRGDHLGDALRDEGRDDQRVDEVGEQHRAKHLAAAEPLHLAQDREGGDGQQRPERHHRPERSAWRRLWRLRHRARRKSGVGQFVAAHSSVRFAARLWPSYIIRCHV